MVYHKNSEIKARCADHEPIRKILKENNADFHGLDHQIDTYFKTNNGRLKLRESELESGLIYYERENLAGPKQSDIRIYFPNGPDLKNMLMDAYGILTIVDKQREIYFIDNVKFHLDVVKDLGKFVEIEAISNDGKIGYYKLEDQCKYYMQLFGIKEEDLINDSYSDMLL